MKRFLSLILASFILLSSAKVLAQKSTAISGQYLEVANPQGKVFVTIKGVNREAEIGDRLFAQDSIKTSKRSQVVLQTNREERIDISENSQLDVKQSNVRNGVSIIKLSLTRGQIKVKKKGSPNAQLIVETGAGTAAPRNTEFGVTLDPSGKMGVATKEGNVVTTGTQGQEVIVSSNFQNLTIPDEPPSSPIRLRDDPDLKIEAISVVTDEKKEQRLQVVGKVDPVNLLSLTDELQEVDRSGHFVASTLLMSPDQKIEAIVTTPLGNRKRTRIWSQTCTTLPVLGIKTEKETVVQKTVEWSPISGGNRDTDFIIPSDQSFQRFWVKIVSQKLERGDIRVYLKYKDDTPGQFFAQQSVEQADTKYTLAIPRSGNYPYQVNVRIGDLTLIGKSYILSVDGCNDTPQKS
jgi:FecR protein